MGPEVPHRGHHPEVHLEATNGHVLSTDCWCEPALIVWYRNRNNVDILVVQHENYTPKHRSVQMAERAEGLPPETAWIDRALEQITEPPKQLPPHEGA